MENWQYRGEGNCSLVVADPKKRKVYRLLKKHYTKKFLPPSNGSSVSERKSMASAVHSDLEQVVSYVRWVMQPLLSPNYVVIPKLITVDENFVSDVVKSVRPQRPARRLKKAGDALEEDCQSVLILPDFCFIPGSERCIGSDQPSATISIEIKPKKSFISSEVEINSSPGVCKFCMHQHLKRQSGQWPETSNYCPLDLFSGTRDRMKHALQSLIETPQNNFKLWRDGVDMYSAETKQNLEDILYHWFEDESIEKNRVVSVFLDMVIEILLMSVSPDDPQPHADLTRSPTLQRCQSSSFTYTENGHRICQWLPQGCVLERVFAAQLLDDLDIEGAYPLYSQLRKHLDLHPHLWSEWGFDGSFPQNWLLDSPAFRALETGSLDWVVQKVKRFLVSKTLQDCSIMVAILPLTEQEAGKCAAAAAANSTGGGNNLLQFSGRWHKVSVALVDLDPKPLSKIPTYHRQACDIKASFEDDTCCGKLDDDDCVIPNHVCSTRDVANSLTDPDDDCSTSPENCSSVSPDTSMEVCSSLSVSEDDSVSGHSPGACANSSEICEMKARTQGQSELL